MGKLAIIGLGLIGTSMGLAIKRSEPENTEVFGFDKDEEVAIKAHRLGAVDRLAPSLLEAVSNANLVIVATPIINMRKVFEEIGRHLAPNTVVTDTASTKSEVQRWAGEFLPAGVHFVGGHPMAGKENSGPGAAEASLFDGRPYCIIPGVSAGPGAVSTVVGLANAIGAEPFFLDANEHDAYAAAISHVPLVASLALFNLARQSAAWPELASMSGPGFRDLTRLASGEPTMSHDIFLTNRKNVAHWLDRYIEQLQQLSDLIQTDEGESLFRMLAETQMERDGFLANPPKRKDPGSPVELPTSNESVVSLMAGGLWRNRAQDLTESLEERQKARDREERLRRRE